MELFNEISELLKSKIRIIDAPNQFHIKDVKNGLIAMHAVWSAYSISYCNTILKILDQSTRTDFEILILNIDKLTPEQQINYLGFVSHGYFEAVWIEKGKVVCKNEYEKGIESFYQFRDEIKKLTCS